MALRALPRCWVQLAGVSGGEKTYSGSSIIIKIYPALSPAIGGWDGMDGGRGHWMTRSNYRMWHQSCLSGASSHLPGVSGRGMGIILIELFIWDVFGCVRGRDEAGECLAMRSRSPAFLIREVVPVGLGFWLLGAFGGGFRW